jgi:transposase
MPTSVSTQPKNTKEQGNVHTESLSHSMLSVCSAVPGLAWQLALSLCCAQFQCSECRLWKAAQHKHGTMCNDCHHRQQRLADHPPSPAFPSPSSTPVLSAPLLPSLLTAAAAAPHSSLPSLLANLTSQHQEEKKESETGSGRKRKYHSLSNDGRATVIRLRDAGGTWQQVEAATAVPRSTARSIVEVQKEEGRSHKRQKGGNHKPVISDDVKRCITALQDSDSSLTLSEIHALLDATFFAGAPSLNTIWRVEKEAGFTTKKQEANAAPRNTLATKEKRRTWCQQVGPTLTAERSIFIDETPFSFCIVRTRGRSRKGKPAIAVTPQIRGKNHSVIAAISPSFGLLYYEIKLTKPDEEFISKRKGSKKKKTGPKGVTRDVFRSFLINLFTHPPFSSPAAASSSASSIPVSSSPLTLVMDNCRIHLGDIGDTIFQTGHIQQLMPAWSPALNPIEYVFSKWKLAYRAHHADSEGAVDEAIRASAKSITPADCLHCFQHTQSLYAKAVAMKDL